MFDCRLSSGSTKKAFFFQQTAMSIAVLKRQYKKGIPQFFFFELFISALVLYM